MSRHITIWMTVVGLMLVFSLAYGADNEKHQKFPPIDTSGNKDLIGSIQNDDLTIFYAENGQFTISRTSDGAWLLYPSELTTYFSVNIDGQIFSNENNSLTVLTPTSPFGDGQLRTVFQANPGVSIIYDLTLVGPALRMSWGVENDTGSSLLVEFRQLLDTQIDDNDGSPIYVPGQGVLTHEREFDYPSFAGWEAWMRPENPFLKGVGVLSDSPSRFVTAYWEHVFYTSWAYSPDTNFPFFTPGSYSYPQSDSAVLIYIDAGVVSPWSSHQTVSTYYGLEGPQSNSGTEALIYSLDAMDSALQEYLDALVYNYASAVGPAMKEFIDDHSLRSTVQGLALDLAGGDIPKLVGKATSKGIVKAAQTVGLEVATKALVNAGLHWSAGQIIGYCMENIEPGTSEADIVDEIVRLVNSGNWGASQQGVANIVAQNRSQIQGIIASVPPGLEYTSEISKIVDALNSVTIQLRNNNPSEDVLQETKLFWSIPGSCEIEVDLNPVIIGSFGPNARYFKAAHGLYHTQGSLSETKKWVCAGWATGVGAFKLISIIPSLFLGGAPQVPIEAVYWGGVHVCQVAGYVESVVEFLSIGGLFWQMASFDGAMNSEVNLIDHFVAELVEDLNRTVPYVDTFNFFGCSTDISASLVVPSVVDAPFLEDPVVPATVTLTNGNSSRAASVRCFIEVRSKSDVAMYPISFFGFDAIELSGGEVLESEFEFVLPRANLFGTDNYSVQLIVVGSGGVVTSTRDLSVCGDVACVFIDESSPVMNGFLGSNQAQESGSIIGGNSLGTPAGEVAAATWTLAFGAADFDLHLFDEAGNHVGLDYSSGEIENQIPGATYSGSTGQPEAIRVMAPESGEYVVRAVCVSAAQPEGFEVSLTTEPVREAVLRVSPVSLAIVGVSEGEVQQEVFLTEIGNQMAGELSNIEFSPILDEAGSVIEELSLSCGSETVQTIDPGQTISLQVRLNTVGPITEGVYFSEVRISTQSGEYLIPIGIYFVSSQPSCLWTDATTPPLDNPTDGHGIAWGDFDNDGDDDLFLANAGDNALLRNDGEGSFTKMPNLPSSGGDSRSAAWADYDNDGDLDLYLVNWGSANHLYRNDGGGEFSDVTTSPLDCDLQGNNVAWADFDNDGDMDLFFTNFDGPNKLVRNDGGTFVLVEGTPLSFTDASRGAAWGDFDADNDPDLYVSVQDGPNRLFRNDGGGMFLDVTTAPLDDDGSGKGVAWADYDNDGDLDLYLVNRFTPNRLFNNDGGVFTNVADEVVGDTGDGRTCGWGDYNNDGWLDLFITNNDGENKLFHNLGGEAFADTTCGDLMNPVPAWGMGWSDYDNDGDLDMYVSHHTWEGLPNHMFRNDLITNNSWLQVELVGTQSNRFGVGARVQVGSPTSLVTQTREITAGSGYMSQPSVVAQFGLNQTNMVDVTIYWPSGVVQHRTNQAVNTRLVIEEPSNASGVDDLAKPLVYDVNCHPNPFNPMTNIEFSLPRPGMVSLQVYDLTGRLMRTLVSGTSYDAGTHTVPWNGTDKDGRTVASGVYFYRFESGDHRQSGRMVLLK